MRKISDPSIIRRFTHWFFSPPFSPWVTVSFAVDAKPALDYLKRVEASTPDDAPHVTVNDLLAGVIGRTLREHPELNRRILGRHYYQLDDVGLAMPVNLVGHEEGASRELGLMFVPDVDKLSLQSIAARSTRMVNEERVGKSSNPLVNWTMNFAKSIPGGLLGGGFEALDRALRQPRVVREIYRQAPVSAGLTNPGAAARGAVGNGLWIRGGSMSIPDRMWHIGSVWGLLPVQDEVVPIDGVATVRPVMPGILIFDHRLIDGVRAGQVIRTFAEKLRDPEPLFGPTGEKGD